MLPEDIDDLFHDKLAGHQTPPADALWARLQAGADAAPDAPNQRLDQLFQQGLNTHATPPGRELWERLEDEHLRPRKRRPAAWWPMALAAAVALLLVAGGAGLWLGFPAGSSGQGTLATQPARGPKSTVRNQPAPTPAVAGAPAKQAPAVANNGAATLETAIFAAAQKNVATQATRSQGLASTAPKAKMSAAGPSPRHLKGTNRQPDAATGQAPLLARTTPHAATQPPRPTAADEQLPAPATAVAVNPTPAPEIVPAQPIPAPSLASTGELITVDVRNGATPTAPPTKVLSTALAAAQAPRGERRRLGSRLLQQAGHLVRGERVSLAEVTGLPETVTVRATVAGRSVTKSIQL
ncbi:hypothetical protein [Hymenobacter terrenus]|uniref:hypothetical protein n=1 Tax=Hymenobacter terrenus TaxID=1629124 RepID=UPI000619A70E|nr:hypothetical protein [Hymenobacter terrenus]